MRFVSRTVAELRRGSVDGGESTWIIVFSRCSRIPAVISALVNQRVGCLSSIPLRRRLETGIRKHALILFPMFANVLQLVT